MNGELQSTNEELVAKNDELREQTAELDLSNAFLSSRCHLTYRCLSWDEQDMRGAVLLMEEEPLEESDTDG